MTQDDEVERLRDVVRKQLETMKLTVAVLIRVARNCRQHKVPQYVCKAMDACEVSMDLADEELKK